MTPQIEVPARNAYSRAMRRFGVGLVLSWLLISAAHADQPASPPDPAKVQKGMQLFEAGRKLLAENNPEAACEKFNESILMVPDAAGTMLNLGLCNEKLGKLKTALYWFRKAQARANETAMPEHEQAARDKTAELAAKVATVQIKFNGTAPPNTKVKIDGEPIRAEDYERVEVDPGHHVLEAGAPGTQIFRRELDVQGKGGETIAISLVAGDSSIVVDRGAGRRRIALYLALGGGVAWTASAGISLWARSRYDHYGSIDPPDPVQQNHYRSIARYYGTSLLIAGTAAVGLSAYLYFTAPAKERIDQTVFVPAIGRDQIGVAASGSF